MKLDGKRIVLTGAASGIGRALTQELAAYQVQIVPVDIDGARLQDSVADMGSSAGRVVAFACDLSRPEEVDRLFAFALEQIGGVDLFFANAGFGYCERLGRADWQHIEAIYRTNALSPIYAAVKMRELGHGLDYRVVITASVLGRIALEGYALYASTKAALERFAEAYRLEAEDKGRLVLVYPMPVRTDFFRRAGNAPLPPFSQAPEQVAQAVVRGVERDRETIYTSRLLPLLLLVDRFLPFARRLYQKMDARVFRRWLAARATEPGRGGPAIA